MTWCLMLLMWVTAEAPRPTFAVSPASPLMDDRLAITISGLHPGHSVTIRARARASDGRWWRSAAVFVAGPEGRIDLGAQAPVSGTYRGWEGLDSNRMPAGPAWTHRGQALPYIPNKIGLRFASRYVWDKLARNPLPTTPLFLENLVDSARAANAEIPVESIRGPVLLLSGKDDQVWPSSLMAGRVIARLRQYRHPFRDEHVAYANAGHWLPESYVPTRGSRGRMKWAIGGTAEATAKAQADGWPRILRFLAEPHP